MKYDKVMFLILETYQYLFQMVDAPFDEKHSVMFILDF